MRARTIRTNKWHAVRVGVETDDLGIFGIEKSIRVNGYPSDPSASAFLTPSKARALADALIEAAKIVEAYDKRRSK